MQPAFLIQKLTAFFSNPGPRKKAADRNNQRLNGFLYRLKKQWMRWQVFGLRFGHFFDCYFFNGFRFFLFVLLVLFVFLFRSKRLHSWEQENFTDGRLVG